jgi:hypothetical protein
MSSRLAIVAIIAALMLAGCGTTPPSTAPASATSAPAASELPASLAPSPSPNAALPIDESAYLVGETFTLPVDDAGADWTAPSPVPVMPDGKAAARVAFLPSDCSTGAFRIDAEAPPKDDWETTLQDDATQQAYTFGSWPGAQLPECADGRGWTYLDVAYRPIQPIAPIHLTATVTNAIDAPTAIEVIPVFTSADATQPALATNGFASLTASAGPEKSRGAKPKRFFSTDFGGMTLPDGSTPTMWGYELTGCGGPVGEPVVAVTAQVGDTEPVEVGACSDGSFQTSHMALPIPPDGTPLTVFLAGGTNKSLVRVSEFQWRGDRP